jgi:two-component system phosphate regulon response regulator PhoB
MENERPPFDGPEQPAPSKGEEVHLTSSEARLLEVLRSQPGRVFSRSELVALVMPDTVVLERTIDVHIKALRQKLGPLGRQIETVRKAGYRFPAEPQRTEESPG